MRRSFGAISLALALALAAGCGGGSGGSDVSPDVPPDAQADVPGDTTPADPGAPADAADPGPADVAPPDADAPGDLPVEDPGTDAVADPGTDAVEDPGADVALDAGTDVPPDVTADTIENQMDAWFGKIRPECRPADPGCREDKDCAAQAGTRCVATGCVAPVQPAAYPFSDRLLAVSGMRLPDPAAQAGFDFNGDGVPDNQVASVVASFPDGVGVANRLLSTYVQSGVVSLMMELRGAPQDACGPMTVALHSVTRDVDLDGLPEDGGYQVRPDSFRIDGYGPIAQLNTAAIDGSLVLSGPGVELPLKVPLTDGTQMTLPLEGLRIEALLPASASSWLAGSQDAPAVEPVTAVLGGYVRLSRVVDEANRQGRYCACAGVNPDQPLASFSTEGDMAQAKCDQGIDDKPCDISADGRFCGNLGSICLGLMFMASQADVPTGDAIGSDGAPVNDALSLAVYLDLVPAALAEPPLAPDFAAVGDTWRMNPDCDQLQDDGMTQIGVIANDFVDPAVAQPVVRVSAGEAGATIVIGPRADRVFYTPAAGWYGFDSFTYTIQDGHGNESTAQVDIRVAPKLYPTADGDFSGFCRNWCIQASICDQDNYQSQFQGNDAVCESECMSRYWQLFGSMSECGKAWRTQEICRAALPCFNLGEFDAAMADLAAGGKPAWYQCWDEVQARVAACGTCERGTKPDPSSPGCIPDDLCHPDPCTGNNVMPGSCMPSSGQDGKQDYYCQCENGAMWMWTTHVCGSWCDPNPCTQDPNSTGECFAQSLDWICGCKENFYYDYGQKLCVPTRPPA